MSSVDQAQYATMEEGDFDWEHGGGSHDWNWEPTEQAVCMTDSQNQRAPLDMTPGPIYLMREPEGGAWSFMSLRRWKQPTMTTMPRVTLSRPPGLGIMSLQVAEKKVTNVKNRFMIPSEDKCQCCVTGAGEIAHTAEGQDDIQREVTANETLAGQYVKVVTQRELLNMKAER